MYLGDYFSGKLGENIKESDVVHYSRLGILDTAHLPRLKHQNKPVVNFVVLLLLKKTKERCSRNKNDN